MKNLILLLMLCGTTIFSATAQERVNPIEMLQGQWVLKVQNVSPAPADDSWQTTNTLVEFKPILEGRGLIQTTYNRLDETEVYFFYDSSKEILYGSSVDANGYLWRTEMPLNDKGDNFGLTTGGPVNDATLKVQSDLKIVSKSEMTFTHTEFKDGKEVLKASGTFHRMPKW